MTTRLHLRCGGCDAEAYSEPIRKRFEGVTGRPYGFGSWRQPDLDAAVPDGWVWSDPYTACTYCPTCWAEIEVSEDREKVVFAHATPKCDHVFAGWREFESGGEQVCTKCGIGAMSASLREGL